VKYFLSLLIVLLVPAGQALADFQPVQTGYLPTDNITFDCSNGSPLAPNTFSLLAPDGTLHNAVHGSFRPATPCAGTDLHILVQWAGLGYDFTETGTWTLFRRGSGGSITGTWFFSNNSPSIAACGAACSLPFAMATITNWQCITNSATTTCAITATTTDQTSPTYYDWLIMGGFILFFLAFIAINFWFSRFKEERAIK